MAGGKETPRQKMIGMMYLVLTALLALNVSKEVIAAFVTINDKLNASSTIIDLKSEDAYGGFDQKKAALIALRGDLTEFNKWHSKAEQLKHETQKVVSYILSECNDMIKTAEGEDWILSKNSDSLITELKPLIDLKNMDNYDVPTNMFVGSNPNTPKERGQKLRQSIHDFRDKITVMMATYQKGKQAFSFTAPETISELESALNTVNIEDRERIKQIYATLTLPEQLPSHEVDAGLMPWVSVTFDHAPVVAAASLLNALKLDVKNAESMASDFLLSKIHAPIFEFNKIEPLAFASSGYINAGDSLNLSVMVAAYDSTAITKIRYGIDADTLVERWTETTGKLALDGSQPGQHKVKGAIGVKERGETVWKPWTFNYTVGKPLGIISQPNMRVLYRKYDNELEGTASGYPADKVTLSGSGCTLRKRGNVWIAIPNQGVRLARISVIGTNEDGSKTNLGAHEFKVKNKPTPKLFLGGIKNGMTPGIGTVRVQRMASVRYDNSVNLTNLTFTILSGTVSVKGIQVSGRILPGGRLDDNALRILRQSAGKEVTISAKYRDNRGTSGNAHTLQFLTRR